MQTTSSNRRRFIQATAAAFSAPLILPSRVWSQESAPSKRIALGFIGMGKMNGGHLKNFLNRDDCQVLAVCDVDTTRRENAKTIVETTYADKKNAEYKGCGAYNDFRELLARKDIDAVVIATPDHWHAYIAIAAVNAGKDVYCEKPLTLTIEEGKQIRKVLDETKRVFQVGTQQRTEMAQRFLYAIAMICDGRIGEVKRVVCDIGGAPSSGRRSRCTGWRS